MSIRSLKIVSSLFFILIIAGIALSVSVIRMKHSETNNQFFQGTISKAEQFVQTFRTMDSGLREKMSQLILEEASRAEGLRFLLIQDQQGKTILLWQSSELSQTPESTTGIPYIPIIPNSDFWSQVIETNLTGAFRLVTWTQILGTDELVRIGIFILALLIGFITFLVIQMLVSTNGISEPKSQENIENLHAIENEPSIKPAFMQETAELIKKDIIETIEEKKTEVSINEKDSRFVVLDRKSGVSHEKFLPFRLDKELERSAENVLDLSLALFRFQNISPEDHSKAAALILSEFSHEDLIFEYGSDCFCVILPQHDLDQAIVRAELLIRKTDSYWGATGKEPLLIAGLSSRNGRLLESKRFLKEVNTALHKANIREGRIVGFRPDPVRFRNFLRHQRI